MPKPELQPGNRRPTRAFTLVELLVVVAVVAVLMGLTLTVLGKARTTGAETRGLSQVRTIVQSIGMYAGSQNDLYPVGADNPFHNWVGWGKAMKRAGLFESGTRDESIGTPGSRDAVLNAAVAYSPELMRVGRTVDPNQAKCVGVRHSQVAHPSGLGLISDDSIDGAPNGWWCCGAEVRGPLGFCDGSAEVGVWTAYLPNGTFQVIDQVGYPCLSTWGAYLGRDR